MGDSNVPEEGWIKKDGVWFREDELAPETVEMQYMRRSWWIKYNWINITPLGNKNILYLNGGVRPIEEAQAAANNFDICFEAYRHG
jgi:hypothetical protein